MDWNFERAFEKNFTAPVIPYTTRGEWLARRCLLLVMLILVGMFLFTMSDKNVVLHAISGLTGAWRYHRSDILISGTALIIIALCSTLLVTTVTGWIRRKNSWKKQFEHYQREKS